MKKILIGITLCLSIVIAGVGFINSPAYADTTEAGVYGGGDYGSCNYGTCTITLTSGTNTDIDITPAGSGKCTVHSDTTSVETGSSGGYTLTMTTNTTTNALTGSSGSIAALGATAASPATLNMNTWGYRVDGVAGFGSGPTTTQDSADPPSLTFAGVPDNTGPGTLVASSSVAASPAVDTTVWYGACADTAQETGTYTATVLYTAVAN